jgi:tetratricopeptide (TPR) repeat protein
MQGLPLLEEALRELDPATQPADLALALALVGRLYHFGAAHTQAIAALERARTLAEPLDDPPALVWIYSALSGAYQHLCEFDTSDAWAHACIALGERRTFLPAVCIGHEMLAENACLRGNWQAAREHASADQEIARRIGDQDRLAWSGYPLAFALHGQGQFAAAEVETAASLALTLRIGDLRLACWVEPLLAIVYAEQGRHATAADHAARAQQRAAELNQTTLQAGARHAAIVVAQRRGDLVEAAAQAAQDRESALATEARAAADRRCGVRRGAVELGTRRAPQPPSSSTLALSAGAHTRMRWRYGSVVR